MARSLYRSLYLACLFAAAVSPSFAEVIPVSSLDLSKMTQGWGNPGINQSVLGTSITIAGQDYESGVGTHSTSRLFINLDGKAEKFEATVGLNASDKIDGSVEFEVYADQEKVFDSGVMRKDTPAKKVEVPLAGVRQLLLKVGNGGDGKRYDYGSWADARIITSGEKPQTMSLPEEAKYILTPKPGPAPRINTPAVYGARPGNPFLYRIPATGTRPMKFRIEDLPGGLELDAATGIITGTTPAKGKHQVTIRATNSDGETSRSFTIISGDTLSLTPYMGWNDWYTHYDQISDEKMRAAADAMVENGMADYGYSYVAIDDCWMRKPGSDDPKIGGDPRDGDGNILPNANFPDMKALTDYIHAKGLKAGIYTSPGPLTCEQYAGAYEHEEQDARTFAHWGFDLLKYDWCSYGKAVAGSGPSLAEMQKPYEIMGAALQKQNRDIIYNLCQYGMGEVWRWGADVNAHSWRTSGDLGFALDQVIEVAVNNVRHRAWNGPGRWNDPDYLQIGYIGNIRSKDARDERTPSPLTPTEQYSFMSLWCLMAAPLVYSGDITYMDEFTLNILCNPEVIEVNQDPLGQCAAIADLGDEAYLLVKDMADGSKAIGLCNNSETTRTLKADWAAVGVQGRQRVRDLWRHKDIGVMDGSYQAEVPRHGVAFVRLFRDLPAE